MNEFSKIRLPTMTFSPNSVEKIVFAVVRFGFSCECSVVCGSMTQNFLSCFARSVTKAPPRQVPSNITLIKLYPCLATECTFFYFAVALAIRFWLMCVPLPKLRGIDISSSPLTPRPKLSQQNFDTHSLIIRQALISSFRSNSAEFRRYYSFHS
jgi:hypothetical protein